MLNNRLLTVLIALTFLLLSACSSNDVNQPTELEDIKPVIKVSRIWKKDVGVGSDGGNLKLQLASLNDLIFTVDADGEVFAIEKNTGKKAWSRETDELVTGGIHADIKGLYYTTMQGEVVALDTATGEERWRKLLTSEAVAPPSSNGEIVVVHSIDGKITAFNVVDGEQRWRFDSVTPKLSLRGTSSPVVKDDVTISGFSNGELTAFDNVSGKQIWTTSVGSPKGRTELERLVDVDSQPLFVDELIYSISFQGTLAAINAETGRILWTKQESSYAGIARGFSHLYVSNSDGVVSAYKEKNAQPAWKSEKLKYRRLSLPVVYQNTVALADLEGYVHFLSQVDGEIMARIQPDSDGVMGDMQVVDDTLYIYTHSGELFAYSIIE